MYTLKLLKKNGQQWDQTNWLIDRVAGFVRLLLQGIVKIGPYSWRTANFDEQQISHVQMTTDIVKTLIRTGYYIFQGS